MQLKSLYQEGRFVLSFELFPPKTASGETALFEHLKQLISFKPGFFTCTYGAGGSTRDNTLDIIERTKQISNLPVASHLTCVGATADQLREYLSEARSRDIDYIVALRGDPPKGEEEFKPVDGGLQYANELVTLIRDEFPEFGVVVAGYPETHREAPSPEVDLANLKRKVDAGADLVVTQLYYSNEDYFRFRDRCEAAGISVPIVPGILPATGLSQIQRISSMCGARLPEAFVTELRKYDESAWQFHTGVEHAAKQVQELIDRGVPGVHFYVLNKSQATAAVVRAVGPPFGP
ncbi:MAG: methylenetetrahydrofolate reductase [NAD(P)H] [Pirellulaceae bacterium]